MANKFHGGHDRRAHKFLHIQDSDDHLHLPHVQNDGIFEGQSNDIFQDIVDQLVFQSNTRLFMALDNRLSKED